MSGHHLRLKDCRRAIKAQTCGSILDRNWGTKNSRLIRGKLVFRLERAAPNEEGAAVVNKIAISSLSGPGCVPSAAEQFLTPWRLDGSILARASGSNTRASELFLCLPNGRRYRLPLTP